jgi:hypothetical protein
MQNATISSTPGDEVHDNVLYRPGIELTSFTCKFWSRTRMQSTGDLVEGAVRKKTTI